MNPNQQTNSSSSSNNNFILKTNEHPLLGKFISLMYLLSNKKDYGYKLLL